MIVKRKCLCCGDTYEVQDYIEQELCYRCNLDKYKQSVDTCKELAHQANELERENTELKEQIEKMKCCSNCKNYNCLCDCFNEAEQYCDKWKLWR